MIPPSPVRGSALGAGTYELDPPHTFVLFSAKHLVVGRVDGRFDRAKGTITVAPDLAQSTVDVSIDPQSLSTQNGVRDEDLRGPDFFAAVKYPVVTYQGRGVSESGDGWIVDGALTIRDVARAVPLWFAFKGTAPVVLGKPNRIALYAKAAVKRADFGMMRELLDEIGFVSDAPDVWITIDAELVMSAAEQL
jgi:polyisoprenoid-binding protein YceI